MKKQKQEAVELARYIHIFLHEYAPVHLTSSRHTLKSYQTALFLFITFLECEKGVQSISLKPDCFCRVNIEYKDLQQWHCEQQAGIIKNIFKISGEPEPLISISLSGGSCNPTKKRNPQKNLRIAPGGSTDLAESSGYFC